MKLLISKAAPLGAILTLTACMNGEGVEIGQYQGNVLYQTSCQVEQSTIGTRNFVNGKTFHEYGTCLVEAENRCGEANYDIVEVTTSEPYTARSQYPVAGIMHTLLYTYKDHDMTFVCKA